MVLHSAAPLFAQFDFPAMGGRGAAMGGVSVVLDDPESAMRNVAGLAQSENRAIALAFRQNYAMSGLSYGSAGVVFPVSFGTFSSSYIHYGDADYNEQMLTLSYAMPLGKSLLAGVSFHYLYSATSDAYYIPQRLYTFTVAIQYMPSEDIFVGFRAFNPIATMLNSKEDDYSPSCFNLGIGYNITSDFMAVAEVEKLLFNKPSLRFGVEYSFWDFCRARVGVNTEPTIFTFGFGIERSRFAVDIAAQIHGTLGLTPQLSTHYFF